MRKYKCALIAPFKTIMIFEYYDIRNNYRKIYYLIFCGGLILLKGVRHVFKKYYQVILLRTTII